MQILIDELLADPGSTQLVVMPITRLKFSDSFTAGDYHFFPPGAIDILALRPVPNATFDSISAQSGVSSGQCLREMATSATGFDVEVLSGAHLVAFTMTLDWDEFLGADHRYDVSLLKLLSAKAERALDIIRFHYCRLDLPNTLPGYPGSWDGSGEWLGALVFSAEDNESYLVAGAAVESSAIVRGLGLELDGRFAMDIPRPDDGDVAGVVLHGLALYSEALNASNETIKFMRVMTLFEFLADPDEYRNWKDLKGDIVCHCVKDKTGYLKLCERFRELTSLKDASGHQVGLRTLIVHNGKLLPELLPQQIERTQLFSELQGYVGAVLTDMLCYSELSWNDYVARRVQLKRKLGILLPDAECAPPA